MPTKAKQGKQFRVNGELFVVGPPCENKTNGNWYCCTHRQAYRNQWEKDGHISESGKHELAWLCVEHGLEVP